MSTTVASTTSATTPSRISFCSGSSPSMFKLVNRFVKPTNSFKKRCLARWPDLHDLVHRQRPGQRPRPRLTLKERVNACIKTLFQNILAMARHDMACALSLVTRLMEDMIGNRGTCMYMYIYESVCIPAMRRIRRNDLGLHRHLK